jgi:hypothetical protein
MCVTQAEMLGEEYEEAKQKKNWRTRKQKKNGAYSNNYVNSQLKKTKKQKRM